MAKLVREPRLDGPMSRLLLVRLAASALLVGSASASPPACELRIVGACPVARNVHRNFFSVATPPSCEVRRRAWQQSCGGAGGSVQMRLVAPRPNPASAAPTRVRRNRLAELVSARGWRSRSSAFRTSNATLRATVLVECDAFEVSVMKTMSDDALVDACNATSPSNATAGSMCRDLLGHYSVRWWQLKIAANMDAGRAWHAGLSRAWLSKGGKPALEALTWYFGMTPENALHVIATACNEVTTITTTETLPRKQTPRNRNAMCLVGGLRSFSVPAVHKNLARVAREWGADVFANVHTRDDFMAASLQYNTSGSRTCEDDPMPYLLAMQPVHIELNRPTKCQNTAAVQLTAIQFCFERALAHAPYELLARVRPDWYFSPSHAVLWPRVQQQQYGLSRGGAAGGGGDLNPHWFKELRELTTATMRQTMNETTMSLLAGAGATSSARPSRHRRGGGGNAAGSAAAASSTTTTTTTTSMPSKPTEHVAWSISAFNMDCLFVVTRAAAEELIRTSVTVDNRSMLWPTCAGGNNLDTEYPLFYSALPPILTDKRPLKVEGYATRMHNDLKVHGGLLRSTRLIRAPVDIDWSELKSEASAHSEDFACRGVNTANEEAFRVYNHPF